MGHETVKERVLLTPFVFPMTPLDDPPQPRSTAGGLLIVDAVLEDLLDTLRKRDASALIVECERLRAAVHDAQHLPAGSKERAEVLETAMAFQRAARRWLSQG